MFRRPDDCATALDRLDAQVASLPTTLAPAAKAAVVRWRSDAAALRFHLRREAQGARITVVLGGTGTGKSTLVNRLVGSAVTASSFRRTFTAGPVAVVSNGTSLPAGWLSIEPTPAGDIPARGVAGHLLIVTQDNPAGIIVDTPDLDGDQPIHHAQADRAFRWADRIVFVVTPEKYQMTELLPYYRLANRYRTAAMFVMNKCEQNDVADDYRRQLAERDWPDASVFIVARDDAGFEAPADSNLDALRRAVAQLPQIDPAEQRIGTTARAADVAARFGDQILSPLTDARKEVDRLSAMLHAMETPPAGVDVNPITQQLQRRLQQRSVLYLIGPQRMLDRVRQVPTLLARLPRATWDWVMKGNVPADLNPGAETDARQPPDFAATLNEQFVVVRSRIDDALRSSPASQKWIADDADGYNAAFIAPPTAGAIADEEIAALRNWLQTRWNATPRDTRILQTLLKHLPGGKKLTQWSEAAPYLLTLVLIAHSAVFGHIDLLVLGGYSLATWLTERVSNEVTSRTRATNRKISDRFEKLAHRQIEQATQWLQSQAPSAVELRKLERLSNELAEVAATGAGQI